MRRAHIAFVVVIVALSSGEVRADLSTARDDARTPTLSPPANGTSPIDVSGARSPEAGARPVRLVGYVLHSDIDLTEELAALHPYANADMTPPPAPQVVREIREPPGSLGLFLSAILSVGGWHLVRSTRHLHLAALPSWYHTGAPTQIGHAVPFEFDYSASALCIFDSPCGEAYDRPLLRNALGTPRDQHLSQTSPLVSDPRGPPTHS